MVEGKEDEIQRSVGGGPLTSPPSSLRRHNGTVLLDLFPFLSVRLVREGTPSHTWSIFLHVVSVTHNCPEIPVRLTRYVDEDRCLSLT